MKFQYPGKMYSRAFKTSVVQQHLHMLAGPDDKHLEPVLPVLCLIQSQNDAQFSLKRMSIKVLSVNFLFSVRLVHQRNRRLAQIILPVCANHSFGFLPAL